MSRPEEWKSYASLPGSLNRQRLEQDYFWKNPAASTRLFAPLPNRTEHCSMARITLGHEVLTVDEFLGRPFVSAYTRCSLRRAKRLMMQLDACQDISSDSATFAEALG